MSARLLGIAIKPAGSELMHLLPEGELGVDFGVAGDSRGKPGARQVTLMSLAGWRLACAELHGGQGETLPWVARRANLLVDELPLVGSTGQRIQLGDALLEITGETDPCSRMERLRSGLFKALARDWRGGVTCRVLSGGPLRLGMPVSLQHPA